MDTDAIVVGAGLAGLVATAELADAGRKVILLDQEPEASLGGQAFWSLGGLLLVDSPEQRRLRIKDSHELAWQDWLGTAGFDRDEDEWPRRWAEAYVDFAAGEKRAWLPGMGVQFMPDRRLGRARRLPGDRATATRCRASTSRGAPGRAWSSRSSAACARRSRAGWSSCASATGSTSWSSRAARSTGVRGDGARAERRPPRARRARATVAGEFALDAQAVIVTSGGIGGNHELVRAQLAGAARHAADGA